VARRGRAMNEWSVVQKNLGYKWKGACANVAALKGLIMIPSAWVCCKKSGEDHHRWEGWSQLNVNAPFRAHAGAGSLITFVRTQPHAGNVWDGPK